MTTAPVQIEPVPVAMDTASIVPALPGVPETVLAESYAICHDVVSTRARNFYYGLRLTPEPRRSAVYAIYAWMRAGDDAADAHCDPAQQRIALHAFHEQSREVLSGRVDTSRPSMWLAFAATVQSYQLSRTHLDEMLAGLEEDLTHAQYETDAMLDRYCHRVASTVGLVCVQIWGLRPRVSPGDAAAVPRLAERRGLAFQLTNILRDFREDLDGSPSRVYLSRESFARAGLTPAELRAWSDPERCRRYVLEQAARAKAHFEASAPLDGLIDPGCRPTIWAMTRIYEGLLDQIIADPARVVGAKRIRLASWKKAAIAVRAMLASRR